MRIIKSINVQVDASADDWQLYDGPGRNDAASALNHHFEELVNAGVSRNSVGAAMLPKLREFANLGAADSEGYQMLESLFRKTFDQP